MKRVVAAALLLPLASCWQPGLAAQLTVEVHDPAGQPLEDAVIYAEPVAGAPRSAAAPHKVVIDQVNKQFVPLVTIVRTGTEVSFPNSDNIRHSIYSFSSAKTFTTKLYSGKQAAPVVFDTPGVAVLGCNIHDKMAAWVVIVDTPFFVKSGADGIGTLAGLEPGDYRLKVWYPGPQFEPLVLPVHVQLDVAGKRSVVLDASSSSLTALRARATAN